MLRPIVLLAVLAVLAASVAVAPGFAAAQEGTPVATTDAPQRTDLRYFLPYGPDGLNPELTVVAEVSGICGNESLATPGRPDAWDCLSSADDTIYDPCFVSPFGDTEVGTELACVTEPFTDEVVLFRLTAPLPLLKDIPASGAVPEADPEPWHVPWSIELGNGERCTLITGASAVLAGQRVNYGCEGGGSVLGEIDRSQPRWAVSYLADGAVSTTLVDVAVAWA